MIDGIYQSVMCFFMTYLVYYTGTNASSTGHDLGGREQMGVYVATSAIIVVNTYILINQYRWDWLTLLVIAISIFLVYAWTGIYSQFPDIGSFYGAATQVFGALTFWTTTLLTVIVCLLPRMAGKAMQKLFFPRDIDIVREQVRRGEYNYLYQKGEKPIASPIDTTSKSSLTPVKPPMHHFDQDDEHRPIYPPSVAATATTGGKRGSGNGSDGTDISYQGTGGTFTPRRFSLERHRPSMDRARPSIDRFRTSMDRTRPSMDRTRTSMDRTRASFEQTNDFTSAAMLQRMESCNSMAKRTYEAPR